VVPPGVDAGIHRLTCAAWWVHCSRVRPSSDPRDYAPPRRIQLGEDRMEWPPPVGQPRAVWPSDGWFIGVLNGEVPRLQAGYQWGGAGWSAYG
jgi:hypothetical protein